MTLPISDSGCCSCTEQGKQLSKHQLLHFWGVPGKGKPPRPFPSSAKQTSGHFSFVLSPSLKANVINREPDNDTAVRLLPYQCRKLSLSLDPRLLLFL